MLRGLEWRMGVLGVASALPNSGIDRTGVRAVVSIDSHVLVMKS